MQHRRHGARRAGALAAGSQRAAMRRRTPITDAAPAAAVSRRHAGAAPRHARVPRGPGRLHPRQPRARRRARPAAGPRPAPGRASASCTGVHPSLNPNPAEVGPAPGRVQKADAARPAQELARRAGEPIAADRAHVHRQLAHALRARAAPHSRAGVDKVQHTPRPDRCFLLQRPRFTPRVPRAQGTRHARASSAVSACSAPRRMAATHHAHITSGAARRAATRLAAGPRGRAGARLAGVQEEGNAVPLRHCAHGRHIIYAPAAARRAVRMRWRPAPLTALLAGCCAHAKSAQGRPC